MADESEVAGAGDPSDDEIVAQLRALDEHLSRTVPEVGEPTAADLDAVEELTRELFGHDPLPW